MQTSANISEGIVESPFLFQSGSGQLTGILSRPAGQEPTHLVLFSHGWSGTRNGPGNLLTILARHLSQNGAASLRFDFGGRGESEGDGLNATLATMSEDIACAARELRRLYPRIPLFLAGMCSGGNVLIGSLEKLPDAAGLLLLSVYPFSDGDSFGRDTRRLWHLLKSYIRKACTLSTWKRLFNGEASLARAFRVLLHPLTRRDESRRHEIGQTSKATAQESRLEGGKPAPTRFLNALKERKNPALMIYGTGDPDATAAQKYFGDFAARETLPIQFMTLDGANHNYSASRWHRELCTACADFIGKLVKP